MGWAGADMVCCFSLDSTIDATGAAGGGCTMVLDVLVDLIFIALLGVECVAVEKGSPFPRLLLGKCGGDGLLYR